MSSTYKNNSLYIVSAILLSICVIARSIEMKPFGTQMCVYLCSQYGMCEDPVYTKKDLVCCMSNCYEIKIQNEDWIFVLDTLKKGRRDKIVNKLERVIVSRDGRKVVVQHGLKIVSKLEESTRNFTLDLPPETRQQACVVLSMTISKRHPYLMYLLLQCPMVTTCHNVLSFVDLETGKLLSNKMDFCENQQGNRQIVIGPCRIKKEDNCLFSINFKHILYVTVYKEPAVTDQKLVPEMENKCREYVCNEFTSVFCSFYKKNDLFCLFDGSQVYIIDLFIGNKFLNTESVEWEFGNFSGIKDFKIDDSSNKTEAVIIQQNLLTVLTIDWDRKDTFIVDSVNTDAEITTIRNGHVWLHNSKLDQPFLKCNIHSLDLCSNRK